jgi:hypothetical protein
MSKYSKNISWVDRTFTRKTALAMHRGFWRWQRGGKNKSHGYAYGLKRDGRLEELARFIASQKVCEQNWQDLISGVTAERARLFHIKSGLFK